MFFEHADCLIGICKDVDTCSSQVLTLDLTKYDEVPPQTNNAVDNDDDEFVDQNATGHGHYHDDSHVVDGNERFVDYSPRGSSNKEGVVVASSSSGGGDGAKGRGSTRSVKERRRSSSSSKRKSSESGGGQIYREVIVEETDADVAENDE